MKNTKSERGQAIILVALGFIVILGFVGLAIDMGMVYSDRRHAQNAADASSLAGGGRAALYLENSNMVEEVWNCSDPRIITAMQLARSGAINRAASNEFTIDTDDSDGNGVKTECGSFNNGDWVDHYIDVTVAISTTTQASFSQFVYGGPLQSKVKAVTRVRPRQPLALGQAVVAVNKEACNGNQNGAIFGGSQTTYIEGGGVFTNGCLRGNGANFYVDVDSGKIIYAGNESGTITPGTVDPYPPVKSRRTMPPEMTAVQQIDCGAAGAHHINSIVLTGNDYLLLEPGLWCVSSATNAIRIQSGTLEGFGVTIYIEKGDVDISGNATVHLTAPIYTEGNPVAPAIDGVLLYMAPGNTNPMSIQGNSDSYFVGTVYSPSGDIFVSGSGENTSFNTQFVGRNVTVTGNADVEIHFDKMRVYMIPAAIELHR